MKGERAWRIKIDPDVQHKLEDYEPDWKIEIEEFFQALPDMPASRVPGPSNLFRVTGADVVVRFSRDESQRVLRVQRISEDVDPRAQYRMDLTRKLRPMAYGGCGLAIFTVAAVGIAAWVFQRPPTPQGTATFTEAQRSHVSGTVNYDRSPPAGGNHADRWLTCGVYNKPVTAENAVHDLEHGVVWITYKPSLSAAQVSDLRNAVTSQYMGTERYVLMSPYPAQGQPVVATAWGAQLDASSVDDPRIKQFLDHYEAGSQALEPRAFCVTNGVGTPNA